jgi:ribonuclease G
MSEKEKKELYVNVGEKDVEIALVENSVLVELHKEKINSSFMVGDIYLGRVRRIVPGMNAVFVDIGHEKDAFLHLSDLGSNVLTFNKYIRETLQGHRVDLMRQEYALEPPVNRASKVDSIFSFNQLVMVQIIKEAISTKGPRVSCEISYAGRFLVLVPFANDVMISQKIKNRKERNRLQGLVSAMKPKNIGIIIRTVAENKGRDELLADLRDVLGKWKSTLDGISGTRFPKKLCSELNRTSSLLRDMLNDSFTGVYTNSRQQYENLCAYVRQIAPNQVDIVRYHQRPVPLFEYYGIDRQIKSGFGKIVAIKNGIYLIIEQTEAMYVIDVNSGHKMDSQKNQEDNILKVNMTAATEIARQLRLRDIGGIIIIDFIDMRFAENRKALYNKMVDEMKNDRASHTILPTNKFGLIQITRQRVRPETNTDLLEKCPSCHGSGRVKPATMVLDEIHQNLEFVMNSTRRGKLVLQVHPFVYAYMKRGWISPHLRWQWQFKRRFGLKAMPNYQLLEYRFHSRQLGDIDLWEKKEED